MSAIARPLHREIEQIGGGEPWWERLSLSDQHQHDVYWKQGYQIWCETKDYLLAVEYFQQSLAGCQNIWNEYLRNPTPQDSNTTGETPKPKITYDGDTVPFAFRLAQRLLFCAYCEMDGQATDAARQRLLQGISILFQTNSIWAEKEQQQQQQDWNDLWMELMLSMEEVDSLRPYAKNVALLALASRSSSTETKCGPCGWIDPWQRPGYMVPFPLLVPSPPYIPRQHHPHWCRQLEEHFSDFLQDYEILRDTCFGWSKVGCGDRGSGHDDHRVVVGQDWSEYVLFGTGHSECSGASKTRSLIQQILPDAVSLAEQGGGEVIFSRLAPHTHIQAHCGPTNLRWTAHLGLVVPTLSNTNSIDQSCQIRVGTQWHNWEVGKILLFDDSFEHEVRNDADQERVVLLLRLWHPDLPHHLRETCLAEARQNKDAAVEKRYYPPM